MQLCFILSIINAKCCKARSNDVLQLCVFLEESGKMFENAYFSKKAVKPPPIKPPFNKELKSSY